MSKCLICGEEVPFKHACLNGPVHMRCEGKLADFLALRAENERLRADNLDLINKLEAEGFHNEAAAIRIAELEAALTEIHELLSNYRHGKAKARAAAALKGDTSEIRRRASPDDKHPEDRIVH